MSSEPLPTLPKAPGSNGGAVTELVGVEQTIEIDLVNSTLSSGITVSLPTVPAASNRGIVTTESTSNSVKPRERVGHTMSEIDELYATKYAIHN